MEFPFKQLAAIIVLLAILCPLVNLLIQMTDNWWFRYRYGHEDDRNREASEIGSFVIPWDVLVLEIDVYSPRWEKYVNEVLEITGKYREANEARVLYLAVTSAVDDDNASQDTIAYTRAMLMDYLAQVWPEAGLE